MEHQLPQDSPPGTSKTLPSTTTKLLCGRCDPEKDPCIRISGTDGCYTCWRKDFCCPGFKPNEASPSAPQAAVETLPMRLLADRRFMRAYEKARRGGSSQISTINVSELWKHYPLVKRRAVKPRSPLGEVQEHMWLCCGGRKSQNRFKCVLTEPVIRDRWMWCPFCNHDFRRCSTCIQLPPAIRRYYNRPEVQDLIEASIKHNLEQAEEHHNDSQALHSDSDCPGYFLGVVVRDREEECDQCRDLDKVDLRDCHGIIFQKVEEELCCYEFDECIRSYWLKQPQP